MTNDVKESCGIKRRPVHVEKRGNFEAIIHEFGLIPGCVFMIHLARHRDSFRSRTAMNSLFILFLRGSLHS